MVHKALAKCLLSQILPADLLTRSHTHTHTHMEACIQEETLQTQGGQWFNDTVSDSPMKTARTGNVQNMQSQLCWCTHSELKKINKWRQKHTNKKREREKKIQ